MEYAIVIDEVYDVVVLRDVLRKAAHERHARAAKGTQARAVNRNRFEADMLAKYAQRCEDIRLEDAKRIGLKLRPSQAEKGAP